MPFMVKNQINRKESVTDNLHNLTSNSETFLPTPYLLFQLAWGYLIIIPLIIIMLGFILNSSQLNLTLNMFQIHTPLWLNKLMMMKLTISWKYFTQNMMMIFWILTSRWFRVDWCLPLLQNLIQSILCCFIKMEEQLLQSQISSHTFLCLSQQRSLWNWIMET